MFDALFRGDPYFAALCIFLIAALGVLFLYLTFERLNRWLAERSESILHAWVERNGLQLVRYERRVTPGPFPWLTTWTQTMYHAVVVDGQGRTRRVWLRCGGMLVGVLSRNVDVRWEDEGTNECDT